MVRAYEYRHVVGFEETNLAGNVYYVNHIRWQGRCREMFLRDHAPDVLEQLSKDLCLITAHCSCDYLGELSAFDEILIRMRLKALALNRVTMSFEYWRQADGREELIARGEQQIVCMRRSGNLLEPTPLPATLKVALQSFAEA